MIPGLSFQQFQDALLAGFDEDELEELVRLGLNVRLRSVVPAGPTKHMVFKLIDWSERNGFLADLARAAYLARPRDASLQRIYETFGMAPAVAVQAGGTPVPAAPAQATATSLESMVKPYLKLVDLGVWRDKLAKIEGQVCRIEFDGRPKGSGFLVGADLVMTNYHVLEAVIENKQKPEIVGCRFDYKVLTDGSRNEGEVVKLQAENWLLDFGRYSRAEGDNKPDRELPTTDELDYALVRLARPIGGEPIGKGAAAGGDPRGWISLPDNQPALDAGMPLLIAQHPDGMPLKLAMDTNSIIKINDNGTRVRYATNTEPGSSGSPCFNMDWSLVALHHMGDPAWLNPQFNEGVPAGPIKKRLAGKGIALKAG